jgi:hypothetical protein
MEYLHMQQPMPTNAKGVNVHLTAIDPNGNFQDIGTTTSTVKGNYNIMWTPPVEGAYTVTASFEGSEAYYGSSAETSFGVSPTTAAPSVEPTPTPTTTAPPTTAPPTSPVTSPSPTPAVPPASTEMATTYIAIAAAVIIIVVAVAALAMRRRRKI